MDLRERRYCVYRHKAPNGKVYIGITCQDPKRRWNSGRGYKSSPHFYAAIQKYGWDNMIHEVVFSGVDKARAELLEISMIMLHDSTNPEYGYNHATGGGVNRGYHLTPERRAQISIEVRGREVSEETREKMRQAQLGKRHTEESKQRMREAKLGKKLSAETRAKMRISNRGKRVKKVFCVELDRIFNSLGEAEEVTGAAHENISKVCLGKRRTAGGYHWEFYEAS